MSSIKLRFISLATLVLVLLLIVFLSVSVSTVAAQDQDERGVNVIAGPHAVRAVMINSNMAAGFIQMALFITDANTGEVVSDARVVVKAENKKEEYEGWDTAHNSPNMPDRYDLRMNLGSTGEWVINMDVSSHLGQGGATVMTLEVPALNRYTEGSLVFFGVFAVMALGIVYLFWSTRRNNRRREAAEDESQG